jgi:uncharacterized membrane protein YccC
MTFSHKSSYLLLLLLAIIPFPSFAYMGPGAGITAIGCLIALFAGLWYTLKGFIWLPLKRKFMKSPALDTATQDIQSQQQANDTK